MTRDDEARRAQAITDYAKRVVDRCPALTPEQRSALAELLRPVRIRADRGGQR